MAPELPKKLSIGTVERETGLTKDTLRKWEIRYGFPSPQRAGNGDRLYSPADLQRLLTIKRLLDQGLRPGEIVPLEGATLETLAGAGCAASLQEAEAVEPLLAALRQGGAEGPLQILRRALASRGLRDFILGTLPSLNDAVGRSWAEGRLAVHEEHLYAESVRNLMAEAIGGLSGRAEMPGVLLTTPPGEQHALGLMSVHAMFALAGARCVSLGTQTPAGETILAAIRHRSDIVALSFSVVYPARRIAPYLEELRRRLPRAVEIWAGGGGMDRLRKNLPGIRTFSALDAAVAALEALGATGLPRGQS